MNSYRPNVSMIVFAYEIVKVIYRRSLVEGWGWCGNQTPAAGRDANITGDKEGKVVVVDIVVVVGGKKNKRRKRRKENYNKKKCKDNNNNCNKK